MNVELKANERIDDLQYKGFKIIQDSGGFCFGVDAVLLANFTEVRKGARVLDLGTGTGIIAILLAAKTEAGSIVGLEIQPHMAEMAQRSVILNNLQEKLEIVCGDLKNAPEGFGLSTFDNVVCNPPYMNAGGGLLNPCDSKAISRHEIACTLEDIIVTGAKLLVPGGKMSIIHKPERLVDIICLMRLNKLEPKRIRFVHPSPGKKPGMALIEAARGGNSCVNVLEPLFVYDDSGNYSREIGEIYSRDRQV